MNEAVTPAPAHTAAGHGAPGSPPADFVEAIPSDLVRFLHETERRLLGEAINGGPLARTLGELALAVEHSNPERMACLLLVEGPRLRNAAAPTLPEGFSRAVD